MESLVNKEDKTPEDLDEIDSLSNRIYELETQLGIGQTEEESEPKDDDSEESDDDSKKKLND